MNNIRKRIKVFIPPAARIILIISILCGIIHFAAVISPAFADFFNRTVSAFFRALLSYITALIPFSVGELIFISLPISAVALIVYSFYVTKRNSIRATRYMFSLIAVISLLYSTFVLTFATAYHGTPLDKKLKLDRRPVSAEELYNTALWLAEEVNGLTDEISYTFGSSSKMPYSYREMNRRLLDAYDSFCEEHSFIQRLKSRIKPIVFSDPLAYTHISGVYTYFTGEANINMIFPDYTLPFTAAHELAHQRGIAREDEANFVAFLICIKSEDPYIRYSGYLNLYEYVSSALYHADRELFSSVSSSLSGRARYEMIAYNEFFNKYRDSTISTISGAINDTFLKLQGTPGSKSYGMVVDLAVAYYNNTP
ncbi:MAG: DUF3810 domain-containing protein [Clostridiales bacterium]|nr:DUF3810 domain-containing protein [Clostridiales bacterium]